MDNVECPDSPDSFDSSPMAVMEEPDPTAHEEERDPSQQKAFSASITQAGKRKKSSASEEEFTEVTWEDVSADPQGRPERVLGHLWSSLSAKQLRTCCSRLQVKGYKNVCKQKMLDVIIQTYENRIAYEAVRNRKEPSQEPSQARAPKKRIQCPFRLLNVLFSDQFAEDFSRLGDVASRPVLDQGKAGNDQFFWEKVCAAFIEPNNDDYDSLRFMDEKIMQEHDYIDPAGIIPHDWEKLREIWKQLNLDYKAAFNNFTKSGTHDSNFFSFCGGKLDVYYLRLNLEVRPNLNDMAEADLPEECRLTSERSSSSDVKSSGTKRRRGSNGNDVADAIRDFGSSRMNSELAKQKLYYMQQENARRESSEDFQQWERVQTNIFDMRERLQNQNLDEESRSELLEDINGLKRRKEELGKKLGFE